MFTNFYEFYYFLVKIHKSTNLKTENHKFSNNGLDTIADVHPRKFYSDSYMG